MNTKNDIANAYDDFYINAGSLLAKDIDCINISLKYDSYIKDIDKGKAMYVSPTTETGVINIASKFHNKTLEDVNGICIKFIRNVIQNIVKPYTYICNLSLQTDIFLTILK